MTSTCGVAEENVIPHLKSTTVRYHEVRVKTDPVNVLQNFNVLRTILNICILFSLAIIDLFNYFLRFTSACNDS